MHTTKKQMYALVLRMQAHSKMSIKTYVFFIEFDIQMSKTQSYLGCFMANILHFG